MEIKTIYLFRHGQTDWNKEERIQGATNIPLNETGIEQAKNIAKILKNENLEHIYSSPLDRAYVTGKIVADESNIEVESVENLKEISFGDYFGRPKIEVKKEFGEDFYRDFFHKKVYDDFSFPNGEKKIDAINRFTNCVNEIVENTKYNKIGIAAHGFVIVMFLLYQNFIVDKKINNCTIIKCIYENSKIKEIEFIN